MTGGNDLYCRQDYVYVMYWLSVYSTELNMLGIGSENIFDPINPVSIGYTYDDKPQGYSTGAEPTNLTGRISSHYLCYVSITCGPYFYMTNMIHIQIFIYSNSHRSNLRGTLLRFGGTTRGFMESSGI